MIGSQVFWSAALQPCESVLEIVEGFSLQTILNVVLFFDHYQHCWSHMIIQCLYGLVVKFRHLSRHKVLARIFSVTNSVLI